MELVALVRDCDSFCIDLQVPSFSDDAMDAIMATGKNVVLSLHSTMCNLQAEEGIYKRLLHWGDMYPSLRLTWPSEREVAGLNAILPLHSLYLPNTFSYHTSEKEVRTAVQAKVRRPIRRVSLLCAYRPLKNIITQIAAVALAAREIPLELHLCEGPAQNALYHTVQTICSGLSLPVVYHPSMSNRDCYRLASQMDLGLQVSLSETFSYAACEHMMSGVPVIGSSSIPYATLLADYSDVNDIATKIIAVLQDPHYYQALALFSHQHAIDVATQNELAAVKAIAELVNQ